MSRDPAGLARRPPGVVGPAVSLAVVLAYGVVLAAQAAAAVIFSKGEKANDR